MPPASRPTSCTTCSAAGRASRPRRSSRRSPSTMRAGCCASPRACSTPPMRSASPGRAGCTISSSPTKRCRPASGRRAAPASRSITASIARRSALRSSSRPTADLPASASPTPARSARRSTTCAGAGRGAEFREDAAGTAALAQPHFRAEAVAARLPAARRHDRHRFRGAGVGGAAQDPNGPRHHLFRHRRTPAMPPRRRAPSALRSARTRSPSWCRATACSARAATSPAITGASPASARCWAGKRGRRRR